VCGCFEVEGDWVGAKGWIGRGIEKNNRCEVIN